MEQRDRARSICPVPAMDIWTARTTSMSDGHKWCLSLMDISDMSDEHKEYILFSWHSFPLHVQNQLIPQTQNVAPGVAIASFLLLDAGLEKENMSCY